MFHKDVAEIDSYVAHVLMVVHVCCKRLFQMFYLFFKCMLQVCLSRCCICFTHMLQVFYLHVAYVCNGFQVFLQVFQTYVLSILCVFIVCFNCCIWCFKSRSRVAHEMRVGSGWRHGRHPRWRGRRPGRCGPTARALAHKPDALGARSLTERVPSDASASDRSPGASKSFWTTA